MIIGNGSEYQLLRFLGHHRKKLNHKLIHDTNVLYGSNFYFDFTYDFEWLDYPKDNKTTTLDNKYIGIDFFPKMIKNSITRKWIDYWPQKEKQPVWDAIIHCYYSSGDGFYSSKDDLNNDGLNLNKWVLVSAKAYLQEIESSYLSTEKNKEIISSSFYFTQKNFGIPTENDWFIKYYQLAEKISFLNFLIESNIEASLLNIYFINGMPNDQTKNVQSEVQWREKIYEEKEYLCIDNADNFDYNKYVSEIFIDCNE